MSDVALQERARARVHEETDTFAEKINMGSILVIGCISMINSIAMVVYSVVLFVQKQQVLMELLKTLIVAGFLLAVGLGSLHFFRKRLRTLARKNSPWEL